ncbi:DUF1682-domain-containing protein [Dendrothele bispora CBS 962.96]|uniref:DUF1682-domain-containing protein n=1 Tax=Dendrothele bispora (strain CBS 962.96) TaxID=1314807 RepID=A0A4S8N0G4_DENBC|nr:DUF1682-domain-containing protein [Dendrothele bispora CBS 962.96]
MASGFLNILQKITPPPIENPVDYDGWELKWKFLVFRPALLKNEAILSGILVFYVLFWYFGASINSSKTEKWMSAHQSILARQFSKPSVGNLRRDGYSDFFNFSTGRRNIASLHVIFSLRPYHDLVQLLFQFFWGLVDVQYNPKDSLELDFKLFPEALPHDFVWAIVAKDELRTIKDDRWDLTFTRATENPALPPSLSVMSEFADVTESLYKAHPALLNVLKDPQNLRYFRSLSITDQPRDRPDAPIPVEKREKHVILSLSVPPGSSAAATAPLVEAIFPFIDSLSKVSLRPETKNKTKKAREDLDKQLKEDAEKEKKEEMEQQREDQKAAKRKAEQERISKLSAAEQQKILERERKRSIRKSQTKAVRK